MPNIQNVQRIIEVLEQQPDERVCMQNFWSMMVPPDTVEGKIVLRSIDFKDFIYLKQTLHPCNTAACLAGWVVDTFAEKGFSDPLRLVKEVFEIPMTWVLALCYSENWYNVVGGAELVKQKLSERVALITLLCWVRDGNFALEAKQLFDGSRQGVADA